MARLAASHSAFEVMNPTFDITFIYGFWNLRLRKVIRILFILEFFIACGWNYMKPFGHSLVKYVVDVHANLQFHRRTLRRGLGIVRLSTQPKKWRIERGWRSWDSNWRVLDGCEIDALSLKLCSAHGNDFWAWRVFKQSSLDQNLTVWHITKSPALHIRQTLPGCTLFFN